MRAIAALLVLAVPLVAAPVPKALAKRPPSLDGAWVLTSLSLDDRAAIIGDSRWLVSGQSVEHYVEHGRILLNAQLDTPQKLSLVPAEDGGRWAVDLVMVWGKKQTTQPGLFTLDGNTLTLCWATTGERPTDCKPGLGREVRVYKRLERIDAAPE